MKTPLTRKYYQKWRVLVSPNGHDRTTVIPPRSYLLAGAAPFCEVNLPQAAWVAAFVYLGDEAVEVWPLVPQASHLWGCPVVGCLLDYFGAGFCVERREDPRGDIAEIPAERVARWPILKIGAGGKSQAVLVNQPITTLGSGFPSQLRLAKPAMDPCQVVLKWENEELHLIILPKTGKGSFREVQVAVGTEVTCNGLRIQFVGVREAANTGGATPGLYSHPAEALAFEETYRVHYTKIKDTFSSRRSRSDRRRLLWIGAVGGMVSLAAAVCGYYLYLKLSPFL